MCFFVQGIYRLHKFTHILQAGQMYNSSFPFTRFHSATPCLFMPIDGSHFRWIHRWHSSQHTHCRWSKETLQSQQTASGSKFGFDTCVFLSTIMFTRRAVGGFKLNSASFPWDFRSWAGWCSSMSDSSLTAPFFLLGSTSSKRTCSDNEWNNHSEFLSRTA